MERLPEGLRRPISLAEWRRIKVDFQSEVSPGKPDLSAIDRGKVPPDAHQWALHGSGGQKEVGRLQRKFRRLAKRGMTALGFENPAAAVDGLICFGKSSKAKTPGMSKTLSRFQWNCAMRLRASFRKRPSLLSVKPVLSAQKPVTDAPQRRMPETPTVMSRPH